MPWPLIIGGALTGLGLLENRSRRKQQERAVAQEDRNYRERLLMDQAAARARGNVFADVGPRVYGLQGISESILRDAGTAGYRPRWSTGLPDVAVPVGGGNTALQLGGQILGQAIYSRIATGAGSSGGDGAPTPAPAPDVPPGEMGYENLPPPGPPQRPAAAPEAAPAAIPGTMAAETAAPQPQPDPAELERMAMTDDAAAMTRSELAPIPGTRPDEPPLDLNDPNDPVAAIFNRVGM